MVMRTAPVWILAGLTGQKSAGSQIHYPCRHCRCPAICTCRAFKNIQQRRVRTAGRGAGAGNGQHPARPRRTKRPSAVALLSGRVRRLGEGRTVAVETRIGKVSVGTRAGKAMIS